MNNMNFILIFGLKRTLFKKKKLSFLNFDTRNNNYCIIEFLRFDILMKILV